MYARSGGLSLGYLSNAAQECTMSNSSGVLKPSLTSTGELNILRQNTTSTDVLFCNNCHHKFC